VAEEFGPYLVYEQIGLGGMASVHRAEAPGIAGFTRAVALKRMLPHVAANEDLVRSFVREARLASHLRHANVAQTLDLGRVGSTYFIAMELVPGKNLREVLSQCLRVCGPMPIPIAINIISQIADALDYAHNLCDETGTPLGIIHRDVSPSNVIVSEGGVAKLIDFGIAKASAASMQTMSRTIKGKFSYMAPEYIEGRIDPRADLFALGVIAHELFANRPLFQGSDEMQTLHNLVEMKIEPPSQWRPQLPPEIDSIVMTALERDPNARWQGAHAMRTALTTEAQRLGLVAHGAQVDEWMTWAFQQKGGEFRVDTMPEISISNTSEHTAETAVAVAAPVEVVARPSSPHPRVVARNSQPPLSAPPRDEFLDDQRTIQRRPSSPHAVQSPPQNEPVPTRRASTVADSPRRARTLADGDRPDTIKTPKIEPPEDAWPADERVTTTPARPRPSSANGPAGPSTQRPTNQLPAAEPPTQRDVQMPAGPQTVREIQITASPPTSRGIGPAPIAPSGSRTARRLAVNAPIGDVLADLDEHSTNNFSTAPDSAASAAMTQLASPRPRRRGLVLAILLLVAAAATAAVVYFALPYFT
jgi:serine/threonine protein kinase